MKKNINHMHWVIKVYDRNGTEVHSGYFDGTAAQCKSHIKLDYRRYRPSPVSGAQVHFPANRYQITAQPNGMCFDIEE